MPKSFGPIVETSLSAYHPPIADYRSSPQQRSPRRTSLVSQSTHSMTCLPCSDSVTSPPVDEPSGKNRNPPSEEAERMPDAYVSLASISRANGRCGTAL